MEIWIKSIALSLVLLLDGISCFAQKGTLCVSMGVDPPEGSYVRVYEKAELSEDASSIAKGIKKSLLASTYRSLCEHGASLILCPYYNYDGSVNRVSFIGISGDNPAYVNISNKEFERIVRFYSSSIRCNNRESMTIPTTIYRYEYLRIKFTMDGVYIHGDGEPLLTRGHDELISITNDYDDLHVLYPPDYNEQKVYAGFRQGDDWVEEPIGRWFWVKFDYTYDEKKLSLEIKKNLNKRQLKALSKYKGEIIARPIVNSKGEIVQYTDISLTGTSPLLDVISAKTILDIGDLLKTTIHCDDKGKMEEYDAAFYYTDEAIIIRFYEDGIKFIFPSLMTW